MDINKTPTWTKINDYGAPMGSQGVSQNWVRGSNKWFNLDKFVSLKIDTNFNPCYGNINQPQEWAVVGQLESGVELFLKNYKRKERAYAWLGGIMNGTN